MSKDDKKAEYTPSENVAANNVAAENAVTDVAADVKPAKSRNPLSKGAIIGLSAAGVAVILGAGFTGAAIANGVDHGPRDGQHSQFDGAHDGQQGGKRGPQGQNGQQLPGQPGQKGQFVDPDPNDNDGPGTGVAPQGVAPTAPAVPKV
jgi:Zn-dependent alcohol dehydrogenase